MGFARRSRTGMARVSTFARGLGPLVPDPTSNRLPEDRAVMRYLSDRDRSLRYREPRYQLHLIKDLAALLPAGECRVLDVGAGSGLIGGAIAALLPGKSVIGIDIAFLMLYRSGFEVAFGQNVTQTTTALILVAVGVVVFREKLNAANLAGIALCVMGLWLISRK